MNRLTAGVLLLVTLFAGGIATYKFEVAPRLATRQAQLEQAQREQTNDAVASSTVRIGGDDYFGYWFLTSPEMKLNLLHSGVAVDFTQDGGDYATRVDKFSRGEYDMIVLPVAEYLEQGAKHNWPGVIAYSLTESVGADSIVGFEKSFPKGKVTELNNAGLHIGCTPASPSSFMLDATIKDFDLRNIKGPGPWLVDCNGSDDVVARLKRHELDAGVVWEPGLSRVLHDVPDLKVIWGSNKFRGYVIDVVVVNRDYLVKHEGTVKTFMTSYFQVLRSYEADHSRMVNDMMKTPGLGDAAIVEKLLTEIDYFDFRKDCVNQFGIQLDPDIAPTNGLLNSIMACTDVLVQTGKLPKDPLSGDPRQIINTKLLDGLRGSIPVTLGTDSSSYHFSSLDDAGWSALKEIGAMKVEPITFNTGDNALDDSGKDKVDEIAKLLINNYPEYRVVIRGHTGEGDEELNRVLSTERAQAVLQRLVVVHGFDPNRLHAIGVGATQPPARLPGESARALRYRLPRVEFVLYEGSSF